MNTKKIVLVIGVALLLFYIVTQPAQSANIVNTVLGALKDAAQALIEFVQSLFR